MKTEDLKSVDSIALEEIRFILEGIKDGSLAYVDDSFHCGTAHCVAGWHQYFKLIELGYKYITTVHKDENGEEYLKHEFQGKNIYQEECFNVSPWELAQEDWGLTEDEANILFSSEYSLEDRFELLTLLEKGERIED